MVSPRRRVPARSGFPVMVSLTDASSRGPVPSESHSERPVAPALSPPRGSSGGYRLRCRGPEDHATDRHEPPDGRQSTPCQPTRSEGPSHPQPERYPHYSHAAATPADASARDSRPPRPKRLHAPSHQFIATSQVATVFGAGAPKTTRPTDTSPPTATNPRPVSRREAKASIAHTSARLNDSPAAAIPADASARARTPP